VQNWPDKNAMRLSLGGLCTKGPVSIRALAKELGRDYKNVHTDVRGLERVGLICRTKNDKIEVPWDIVEAQLRLAA
jgi:predicted transcriptional regulator